MGVTQEVCPSFLVYGPVGSGLTSALKKFRELQFLTVAGVLPVALEQYLLLAEAESRPAALSPELDPYKIDIDQIKTVFETLKSKYSALKLLYLSTPTEILIQRFAAIDKQHPFERNGIQEAVEKEQALYKSLKPFSDYHIDTSTTSELELGLKIAKVLGIQSRSQPMTIHLTSFGFKHGVPMDAEMVFDMRFLPNPFYDEVLRPQTGLDEPVSQYVFSFPETHQFLEYWQKLLTHSIPLYQQQGKMRLNIAIGCTGGQHRSVAMTMALSKHLKEAFPDFDVRINHREKHHWPQQAALPPV